MYLVCIAFLIFNEEAQRRKPSFGFLCLVRYDLWSVPVRFFEGRAQRSSQGLAVVQWCLSQHQAPAWFVSTSVYLCMRCDCVWTDLRSRVDVLQLRKRFAWLCWHWFKRVQTSRVAFALLDAVHHKAFANHGRHGPFCADWWTDVSRLIGWTCAPSWGAQHSYFSFPNCCWNGHRASFAERGSSRALRHNWSSRWQPLLRGLVGLSQFRGALRWSYRDPICHARWPLLTRCLDVVFRCSARCLEDWLLQRFEWNDGRVC